MDSCRASAGPPSTGRCGCCPELDPAFLPQVRGQPGETMAVRPDLQPGQLYEKAGVAGGYEALDSDQSSDQADQDGWATGTPRKEAGVSACRGAGNQGNADRDTRTDQPASAGTWLACFESTGISDSYGVVGVNRPPEGDAWAGAGNSRLLRSSGGWLPDGSGSVE